MERQGMGLYVVQVVGGQERHAADLIRKVAGASVEDSFVPELEVMKKVHGEWVYKREKLFTGYVFVKTHEPAVVKKALMALPMFARMIGTGNDAFVPLSREEVAWLNAHTDTRTHVLEMSEGIIEGDEVLITSGPLRGQEAHIVIIDRHKRLAWMDVHMFGRTKTIRVGLEIVTKR